jgi:hypothetical protein
MCDRGGLDEKDLGQGAGGADGPPLGVEAAPSGVPAGGPGIGVVAVGVVLAGEFAVGLLAIGQGGASDIRPRMP